MRNHLVERFPAISEVRTAVLWFKDTSSIAPDYFVERVSGNTWIHQPFERYDGMRPEDLAAQLSGKS